MELVKFVFGEVCLVNSFVRIWAASDPDKCHRIENQPQEDRPTEHKDALNKTQITMTAWKGLLTFVNTHTHWLQSKYIQVNTLFSLMTQHILLHVWYVTVLWSFCWPGHYSYHKHTYTCTDTNKACHLSEAILRLGLYNKADSIELCLCSYAV